MKKILERVKEESFSKLANIKFTSMVLIAIFFFAFFLRLYYIQLTDNFSNDAYFSIRQVENIIATGKLLYFDSLSYGGREYIVAPLFYYILAFFKLIFSSIFSYKILPALFISSTVFVVYILSMALTRNRLASLVASLISVLIPIQFDETFNAISPYTLALPLFLLMIYFFINLDKQKWHIYLLILLSCILPLLSPIAFLFILTLMFYLILMFTESIKLTKLKKQAILASTVIVLLIEFLIYKKAFFTYGLSVIWGNVPQAVINNYYANLDLFVSLVLVGIIPLLLGIVGFYYSYKYQKTEASILTNAAILSVLFLLILKLITLSTGLMFLGAVLAILSSIAINNFFMYLQRTKLSYLEDYFFIAILCLVFILSTIPVVNTANKIVNYSIADIDVVNFEWINENTPKDTVVFAPYEYGFAIEQIAKRKTAMDADFLIAPNVNERYFDISSLYSSTKKINALNILDKYNATYLYVPKDLNKKYATKGLDFLNNENCFRQMKKGLYRISC